VPSENSKTILKAQITISSTRRRLASGSFGTGGCLRGLLRRSAEI